MDVIHKLLWNDEIQSWMAVIEYVDMYTHNGRDFGDDSGKCYEYGDGSGHGDGTGDGAGYGDAATDWDNAAFGDETGDGAGTGSGTGSASSTGYG